MRSTEMVSPPPALRCVGWFSRGDRSVAGGKGGSELTREVREYPAPSGRNRSHPRHGACPRVAAASAPCASQTSSPAVHRGMPGMPATRNRVRIGHRVPKTLRSCPEYASPIRLPSRLSSQAIHHEFLEAPHRVLPHRRKHAPAGCRIGHAPLLEALANCLVLQVHVTPEPCELLRALRRSRLWAEAVDGV